MAKKQPPKHKVVEKAPDDFDSVQEFLSWARKTFSMDEEADHLNREAAIEDAKFTVGKQWDDRQKANRTRRRLPTLTFNRILAFVAQIIGNRRMNSTQIKVVPDHGGKKAVARVREGLIRSIQKFSRADRAYDKSLENCVISGIGNFGVELRYAFGDVFEQDIAIYQINNPHAVIWDYATVEKTGADARRCWEVEAMSHDDFKEAYPGVQIADMTTDTTIRGECEAGGWFTQDEVRVVRLWRMRSEKRMLALMNDGDVEDVTDKRGRKWLERVVQDPETGEPIMRERERLYAEMYVLSGLDILEGPYKLRISRVPLFRVPGWEINVGEEVHRFGLVRFLKDPMRLHNYWRSVIAEKLMKTPKQVWVAPDNAVEGRESDWRQSHLSDDPLLIYNAESGVAPQRAQPAQLEPALIQESQMTAQDLRDISNIHEASLGIASNEVSGRAVVARQRVGELGTIIYNDNLEDAIEECGRVLNELIPVVYDTPRVIKILDPDDVSELVSINDDSADDSVDITVGKYAVTVVTGPSTATKRLEAAEAMQGLVNAAPETMAIAADLVVEAQDWPGADKIAARLRKQLPEGVLTPEEMTPEQRQAAAQKAKLAEAAAQAETDGIAAEIALKEADTVLKQAQAEKALADAEKIRAEIKREDAKAASEIGQAEVKAPLEVARMMRDLDLEDQNPASTGEDNGGRQNQD